MTMHPPLTIVIRIPTVTISQAELNASLKVSVDRYEEVPNQLGVYAQLDIGDCQDQWRATRECLQSIRGPVRELISAGSIGKPTLDIALGLPGSALTKSWTIPADLATAAGEAGIDIQLSVYVIE